MKLLTGILFSFLVAGCANCASYNDESMFDYASKLKDIAQAIDGEVKFGDVEGLSLNDIIVRATANEPRALEYFSGYQLQFKIKDGNAVALMCDGNISLIEDAGCSAKVDKMLWNTPKANSCHFSLDISPICQ